MSKKFVLFITTAVCLLPMVLALAVYNDLPDRVVMQWNLQGEPNWDAPKAYTAFGLPIFFAVINLITLGAIFLDPKRGNISDKLMSIVQWIVPIMSLILVPLILFAAMDATPPMKTIIPVLFTFGGLTFIVVGNYLPKCKQNYTVGIKVPWTLHDEDIWNKTHRLAGFLWIIGGILFITIGFLSLPNTLGLILIISLSALLAIVPILYSYLLYRKKNVNAK